jgi:hypothetical protein
MKVSFYSILVILLFLMIEKAFALEPVNGKQANDLVVDKKIEDLSSI